MIPAPVRKPTLTLYAPTLPGTSTADFVYFFPFWADRIPLCTTLDDLMTSLTRSWHSLAFTCPRIPHS